jgi:hypothetical protein
MIEARCIDGNIRHFRATRTGSGIPVQLQVVVSADGARFRDREQREQDRHADGVASALLPNESGRTLTCCNRGRKSSHQGRPALAMHPWSESS